MIALEHRGAALKNLNLGALGVTLDQGDGKILSRQIVRSTKADDASAANNHAPSLAHDNQYSTTLCGRNQSSFSCRISSSLTIQDSVGSRAPGQESSRCGEWRGTLGQSG
jgi:hypothetical protein